MCEVGAACFSEFRPDLILSGINHGSNAGVSILYSGTMGAVLEGCVVNIPSVGFSLLSHDADADFLRVGIMCVVLLHGFCHRVCPTVCV